MRTKIYTNTVFKGGDSSIDYMAANKMFDDLMKKSIQDLGPKSLNTINND